LQKDILRAVGLLALYVVISLLRSVLEPRLVGKHLGLDPLITLLSIYAGYRLWGLPGMLLAPFLAVAVTQFFFPPEKQL
jgi:predicted PurR-regulated permease PerM